MSTKTKSRRTPTPTTKYRQLYTVTALRSTEYEVLATDPDDAVDRMIAGCGREVWGTTLHITVRVSE